MQKYLKNILSDPPYSLGKIANFLLLACAILLFLIYFVQPQENDITLNLRYDKQSKVESPGQTQMATMSYDNLYALIESGQNVNKGDTIFSILTAEEAAMLESWIMALAKGKLKPTKEMLDVSFVNAELRSKMIALAKAQVRPPLKRNPRLITVREQVAERKELFLDLQSAIVEFKKLESKYSDAYTQIQEKYNSGEIGLQDLKAGQKKWKDMEALRRQRENQLETAKLKLFEAESEEKALTLEEKNKQRISKKSDNTFYESDITVTLDSIRNSNYIVSAYTGEIASMGKLTEIKKGDVLFSTQGKEKQSHLSHTLIAEAHKKDAPKIKAGRELIIYLQDGSKVDGEVVGAIKNESLQFEIASSEALSDMDVDQIILPSKNENFIEKVMDNF